MLFAVITLLVVGCTDDNINPTTPEEPDVPEEVVKTASEVLKEIEGVSNIKEGKDEDGNSITSFLFEQPIDHKNPAAGPHRKMQRFDNWSWQRFLTPTIWR